MTKSIITVILFALIKGLYASQFNVTIQKEDSLLITEQLELINQNLKNFPNATQVSFAFIKDGKTTFYGVIKSNDTLMRVNNFQNVFEIGSITKLFTSTILANFVIEGKIGLDEKINSYYKFPFNDNIEITFKQLANHTSGLPHHPYYFIKDIYSNPINPFKDISTKRLEKYIRKEMFLEFKQNTLPHYSNFGAGILAYTLCLLSGKDYEYLLDSLIFKRFRMTHSTIYRDKVSDYLVPGLDRNGNVTLNWDLNSMYGSGGILSSVEDLSKFAVAQFDTNNKDLLLTRERTVIDSTGFDFALGWHIIKNEISSVKLPSETEWYYHGGGTGGYTSSLIIDVNRKDGIILLSNVSPNNENVQQIFHLSFELMKLLTNNER